MDFNTGCVVAFQPTVDFDIEFIRGIQTWMSRLASRIIQYSPQFGKRREEGNIPGGLGNLLNGD